MTLALEISSIHRIPKGTIAIGTVLCDELRTGDRIELRHGDEVVATTVVTALSRFEGVFDPAPKGTEVGVIMRGLAWPLPDGMAIYKEDHVEEKEQGS
jgi:translation elongation factor EF-Tu-like GTPase